MLNNDFILALITNYTELYCSKLCPQAPDVIHFRDENIYPIHIIIHKLHIAIILDYLQPLTEVFARPNVTVLNKSKMAAIGNLCIIDR